MKCLLCESLSYSHICHICETKFLTPTISQRILLSDIKVISFYSYEEIAKLLHTKHLDIGYYIFDILAKNSLKVFANHYESDERCVSLAISEKLKESYSHTEVLNKNLKSTYIKPLYQKLLNQSNIKYSGLSFQDRLLNLRKFKLKKFKCENVILVDDIITSGFTIIQAVNTLRREGKNVLFVLCLADASR